MIYLLHIDTSATTATIAISGDGHLLSIRTSTDSRNFTAVINTMIDEALAEATISLQQLNAIAICAGPGSYTGLRIGMATAKGLCYVLNIPLIADNKLTLLASQLFHSKTDTYEFYGAILLARDKEYFITLHDKLFTAVIAPVHVAEAELKEILHQNPATGFITDVSADIFNGLTNNKLEIDNNTDLDITYWSSYAFKEYNCNTIVNFSTAEPFYLKQVYAHK